MWQGTWQPTTKVTAVKMTNDSRFQVSGILCRDGKKDYIFTIHLALRSILLRFKKKQCMEIYERLKIPKTLMLPAFDHLSQDTQVIIYSLRFQQLSFQYNPQTSAISCN